MNIEGIKYFDADGRKIKPINREATPLDTVFTKPDVMLATYSLHTLIGFKEKKEKDKQPYLNNVANDLVGNSEKLIVFYKTLRAFEVNHPNYQDACDEFVSGLLETYPKIAAKQTKKINSDERHVKNLFDIYAQDQDKIQPRQEYEKKAQTDIKTASEVILRGLVEGSKTPEEIINLAYNIAIAGLSQNDSEKEKKAYQIISFNSPLLKKESFQAANFALSLFFENDDTLAKYIILTYTTDLLEEIYDPQKTYKSNANFLANENEHYQQGLERIKETIINKARIVSLMNFIEEAGKFDFEKEMQKHQFDLNDYIDNLDFPENIISGSYTLRYLYVNRLSELLKKKGEIESDVIPLTMPHDLSVRNIIVLKGDSKLQASKILAIDYARGPGGNIDNPYAIKDVLNYLRPLDFGERINEVMEKLNDEKKKELRNKPHLYGFHPRGDKIITDDSVSAIKSIIFQPGKRAMAKITLNVGKYSFPLLLDVNFNLKLADGSDLNIEHEALVWWETIILSYLKNFLCDPHSMESESTEGMTTEEKDGWVNRYFGRRQHRRQLPLGHHFTLEQSAKYEKEYGMTLAELNKILGRTGLDDQVFTWVFPNDVAIPENIPPVICKAPNAENDVKQVLQRV